MTNCFTALNIQLLLLRLESQSGGMEGSGQRATTPSSSGKKRKRPASISPRRGKKKLSLSEVRKHVNSPQGKRKSDPGTSSSANPPRSIESFFAKAKPPQYTECPVCSEQVKLSEINRHLDAGCLSQKESPSKAGAENVRQSSRKVADVRLDVKDKRTRRRLQDKFESSPLYHQSSSSLSSDDNQESSAGASTTNHYSDSSRLSLGKPNLENIGGDYNGTSEKKHSEESSFESLSSPNVNSKQDRRTKARRSKLSLRKIKETKGASDSNHDSKGMCNSTKEQMQASKTENNSQEKKVTSPYFNRKSEDSGNLGSPNSGTISPKRTPVRTKLFSDLAKTRVKGGSSSTSTSMDTQTNSHLRPSYQNDIAEDSLFSGRPGPATSSDTLTTNSSCVVKNQGLPSFKGKSPLPSPAKHSLPSTPSKGVSYTSPARSVSSGTSPARSVTLGSPHKPREPYYIMNFKLILNAVLKNEFDSHLFNEEDHAQVSKFNSLSSPAQQLYVRLFQRKFTWFRIAKVEYPKIALNLKPLFTEMINTGLLITESSLDDLALTLKLLMAPDLKQLAKDFKVAGTGQKSDLVAAIIKYSARQRSFFSANMDKIVLKKAKKMLGECVKLTKEPRNVFKRVIMLFSLVRQDLLEEEKGSAGQSALYTELLVNMGKMSYPVYTVFRTRSFFAAREDLLRYEVAMQYENDIADALGINDFELADRLQTTAMSSYEELAKDEETLRHDESLPEFLRCYSAGWVYTHIRYQGVEIRQKQRRYDEAVQLLRALLQQKVYCPDRRGGWYDRLALNLDQHCKKQHEALDCIKEGMADTKVKVGHRLALQLRAQKILKSKKKELAERADEFQFDDVMETPKVTIKGTVLPHHGPGVRNTFISSYQGAAEADEGIVVCSVEQVALEHYKQQGYIEGIHGEGTTYSTLIFIIFWDIVFQPNIPDVFCYPYQTAPLDLRTDHFYINRCDTIQEKLSEVREADAEQLEFMLQTNWLEYEGDMCVGVSWDVFKDLDHAKGLLRCIGGKLLSAMAERILTNHRFCRAGRPDLTMWNPETQRFKLVEVKGPGDRLSQKQILWIDFFVRHGIDAEVCHVEAVGSKRLKKKVYDSQGSAGTSSQESVISLE